MVVTQRRYSVTGQTPPDAAHTIAPRPPLDTAVSDPAVSPTDHQSLDHHRGRQMIQPASTTGVRTSSKRSATQLPSPTSPSNQLPQKIARYQLGCPSHVDMEAAVARTGHGDVTIDMGSDTETDSDSDLPNVFLDGNGHHNGSSTPSTPAFSRPSSAFTLPDPTSLQHLQLCTSEGLDDDCMEHLALSPPHSRNHSLTHMDVDEQSALETTWTSFHQLYSSPCHNASVTEPQKQVHCTNGPSSSSSSPPLTFLTLPPEIRHQIYRHCDNIVLDKALVYCISTFRGQMQHPLASVSRQVRDEALAIFYSYNTWVIKVEFRIMYEAFQDWIIRLGEGSSLLRLVHLSVRGSLFKPKRPPSRSMIVMGQLIQIAQIAPGPATQQTAREELYCPPDGDASFKIDLSEKFAGGRVELVRNDGEPAAGEAARSFLERMVQGLWEKRCAGTLNGQDWVSMVDSFITFVGGSEN
jgi:hypothetical protein